MQMTIGLILIKETDMIIQQHKNIMHINVGMAGFRIDLTSTYVDIKNASGLMKKGIFTISISKKSIFVYISRDQGRMYWIGRKTGISAKLSIKFNDKKQMITINNSYKITFHRPKDYETIKKKAIYYKHMKEDENNISFAYR